MRLLAAAFPRSAWRTESDAAYTMALLDAGTNAATVGLAVRKLIREADALPTIAELLTACRRVRAEDALAQWRCPGCGSDKVAGYAGGPAVCFDCDWEGTLGNCKEEP